jgi:hypothetical protein
MSVSDPGLPKEDPALKAGVCGTALFLFRLGVTFAFVGVGIWLHLRLGSHYGAYALMQGVEHGPIGQGERLLGKFLFVAAAASWIRWGWPLVLVAGVLLLGDSIFGVLVGGFTFSELTPLATAGRWGPALALAFFLMAKNPSVNWQNASFWFLRLFLAIVFATHGYEAIIQHPGFVDFIIGTAEDFFGWNLTETVVGYVLICIGIMDITLAALILFFPRPWVLFWMAFWGLVTAFARVTTYGSESFADVFIRGNHYFGPLAVYLWLRFQERVLNPTKKD